MPKLLISYLAIFTMLPIISFTQNALNVNLVDNALRADLRYSGCWVYADDQANEYALIGAASGTAIYELPPDGNLKEVGFIPGPLSNWREITVLGNYAYVTTEGSDTIPTGMQVIDLSQLPDTAFLLTNYNNTFSRGHMVQRDIYSEEPYIYVIGTQTTNGVHILDVSDPAAPEQVGLYAPGYYIHDAHINGDLLFAFAFFESKVDILDISDKSNPEFLVSITDPGFNTHSGWLTEDKSHLILADESDGLPGRIFNIENLDAIFEVSTYSADLASLVHNPYVVGDFCFFSHNTEGLRVVDIKDPSFPVEVGFYDTFDGDSGGFFGLWSACPYLPSKRIIGGDRTRGLFVWEFEETQAARIYGSVIDSISSDPVENAQLIEINNLDTVWTDFNGNFKYGNYPKSITLEVSAMGYESKEIELDLTAGMDIQLVIPLSAIKTSSSAENEKVNFNFFPNPSKSGLTVDVPKSMLGKKIELVTADGKVIYSEKIFFELFQLPISSGRKGIFYIQIVGESGKIFGREKLLRI